MSYVKHVLHLFQSSLLARQEDDTPLTQAIKASILDYLREKYSDPSTNDMLDMLQRSLPHCRRESVL